MLKLNPAFNTYHPKMVEMHNGKPKGNTHQSKSYDDMFDRLSTKISELLYGAMRFQTRTDDIIKGWRYGYAPTAVARYILNDIVSFETLAYGINGYNEMVITHLRDAFKLDNHGWGTVYGYVPALEELDQPAATVQNDINERLRKIALHTHSSAKYIFNQHIAQASVVNSSHEVKLINGFTLEVLVVLRALTNHVYLDEEEYEAIEA